VPSLHAERASGVRLVGGFRMRSVAGLRR